MFGALLKRFQTTNPLRLDVQCNSQGLLATLKQGDKDIPPDQWFQLDAPWHSESRERALHWRRLVEQGIQSTAEGLLWPHARMGGVASAELSRLAGSQRFPYLPKLKASHHLRDAKLVYQLAFLDGSGYQVPLKIYPAVAQLGERFWVLSEPVRQLWAKLSLPRPAADQGAERYAELHQLKSMLAQAGGMCDNYLSKQEVYGLDHLQFDLEDDGQELQLTPYSAQMPAGMDLPSLALRFSQVEDEYTSMGTGGRVVRVLPSPSVREALDRWRQVRRLSGARRQAFLNKPRAFLTQSAIDWDDLDRQLVLIQQAHPPTLDTPLEPFEKPRAPLLSPQSWEEEIEAAEWVEPSQEMPAPAAVQGKSTRTFPVAQLPPSLKSKVVLLQHQTEGLAWLQGLVEAGEPGALLADDMGLGKTLQILCFLEWMRLRQGGTSLVVVPLILLENWKREYLQFFQGDSALLADDIVVLYGEGLRAYKNGAGLDVRRLAARPMVITSLEMLRIYQVDLERIDWSVVVVDEAQNIKNPGAQVSRAANSLRASFRLPATGTPVENHLGDLWSLLDFAKPGYLGSRKEFMAQFRCETLEEMERVSEQLQHSIEALYLRRTKKDILKELPAKHHHFIPLTMPAGQATAYAQVLEEITQDGKRGLEASWILRKASCWDGDLTQEVRQMVTGSCKFSWLIGLLREIQAKKEKVLIFVDIVQLQELLMLALEHELKTRVEVINGQTSSGPSQGGRESILTRFRNQPGFGAIILSPKAAGVGLTLLEANHVVHFSRLWNPAREDQATDRVYRIGQQKEVHVYYPLAEHPEVASFDTYLSSILEKKRALAESALFPALLGDVQSEDMEAFFRGSASTRVQEVPAWVRLLRARQQFANLEDFLAALEPTGLSLYRLLPRVGRMRQLTVDTLARACQRHSQELFMSPLPEDAEAATVLDASGQWVLFLARGLQPEREIDYCSHSLLHRALGHLARQDQRGHWERWSDLLAPQRRWDLEVAEWTCDGDWSQAS